MNLDLSSLLSFEDSYAVLGPLHQRLGIPLQPRKERFYVMAGEYLKKRSTTAPTAQKNGVLQVSRDDLVAWPALIDFLAAEVWPDGSERKPGTLLLFADQGKCKVCLSDRDQALVLFFTAETLITILDRADAILRDESADWRPAKGGTRRSVR